MTFDAACDYLYSLVNYELTPEQRAMGMYLNLDRMREALARAGNPHIGLRCVHIAGTKGKGSTAAMTARILRAAGYTVGLHTKPHLLTIRERLQINEEIISEDDFAALVAEAHPLIEGMRDTACGAPTFFEVLVLLALQWFARQKVDIAVLETGMGGRLDATNVVTPLVTAITTLALDHQAELGDTPAQIAYEKAGIIKPGVPVVSAPQNADADAVIARTAAENGSPLYRVGEEIRLLPGTDTGHFTVVGLLERYEDLTCPLLGAHQRVNAAVAVGIVECLREAGEPVTAAAIRAGLAEVTWPGRLQVLREQPLLLLDGAHDPAAIDALLAALDRHFLAHPRTYILGFARDKDWRQMLRQLAPTAQALILTAAHSPRAVAPEELAREADELGVAYTPAPDVPTALQQALAGADPGDLLCVTGSLYIVGEALQWWGKQ